MPTLAIVVLVVFFAARAMPGDPIGVMLSDHSADTVLAGRLRAEYGLDRPLPEQLGRYVLGV